MEFIAATVFRLLLFLLASLMPRCGAALLRLASIEFGFRILLSKWTVNFLKPLVIACLAGALFGWRENGGEMKF